MTQAYSFPSFFKEPFMKRIFLLLHIFICTGLMAQSNLLPSMVIRWNNLKPEKQNGMERRLLTEGSTMDLAQLRIHASTLAPGKINHPPKANPDTEELIVVKEGHLKVTINDSSKVLGPGGIALIIAGDNQSFQNTGNGPATYYVLRVKSKAPASQERGSEAGKSLMKDWSEMVMNKTDKGERREIFDRPTPMFGRFEVHATALNPGFDSHAPHTHRAEEIILMIKGDVTMQIGQNFHKTAPGDLVYLASGDLHAAKNTGNTQCGYFAIQWMP